jgi:radical SAM superfamily enzyme YgiQ (UPF0313 family)
LAGALERKGVSVRIFDAGRHLLWRRGLKREIRDFSPEVIGLSLRNVDSATYPCTWTYLEDYRRIMGTVRSVSASPVVLGGSAFSIFPGELTAALGAESGSAGDGEASLSLFLDRKCRGVKRGVLGDLRDVGFPRQVELIFPDFRRYRTVGVQTARGCPRRCVYCTYPLLEGHELRRRDPGTVADEMESLHKDLGAGEIFIVDSIFNADEEHLAAVLEEVISRKMKIRFSCYMEPRVSRTLIFDLMARAGCVGVDFGTDSGSPAILHSLGKGFTVEDIRKATQACRGAGIDFCHSLLFGGPGETRATVAETARLMDEVSPRAVIAMTGIRIYPGTHLESTARQEGLLEPGDSLIRPRFYFAGWQPRELYQAVLSEASKRRSWFLPGKKYWSRALGPKLLRLVHREGPLWRSLGPPGA